MKLLAILIYLSTTCVFAQNTVEEKVHPLKNFTVLSNAVPNEFIMMIEHLKNQELTNDQVLKIISYTQIINEELSRTPQPNIMFFLKSETYKGLLTNQYLSQKKVIQPSTSIIESIKQKRKKHQVIYSDFSQWIIQAILKDFAPYLKDDFINQYQNIQRTDPKGIMMVRKINKMLKYLSAWLNAIDSTNPEQFNKLVTKIIIDTLDRISKKTYYFKTFTNLIEKAPLSPLFTLPKPQLETKEIETPENQTKTDLKEKANKRKVEAKKAVKDIDPDDLSGLSEKIDQLDQKD